MPAAARQDSPPARGRGLARPWSELRGRLLALISAAATVTVLLIAWRKYEHEATLAGLRDGIRLPADTADIVLIALGGRRVSAPLLQAAESRAAVRAALHWDYLLIAGYSLALLIGLVLAWSLVSTSARRWVRFGAFTALVTALADCLENWLLLRAIADKSLLGLDCYDAASAFAVVKFCAAIPAASMALLGVGLAVLRSLTLPHLTLLEPGEGRRPLPILCTDPADPAVGAADAGQRARWLRGYAVPPCAHPKPPAADSEITGIGLSGGGVRAASVALGVLQAERFRTQVVPHAQYLVSVSGGGYTAGAFAQALTGAEPPGTHDDQVVRDPATAFLVGSPEEDHLRRHSSYLADSPVHMLTALGLLAGHLLLTLTLLFSPAVLLGIAAGRFYHHVPITELREPLPPRTGHLDLALRDGALWCLVVIGVLTMLCFLAMQLNAAHPKAGGLRRPVSALAHDLLGLSAVLAALTVALPGLIWTSSWLLHRSQGGLEVGSPIAAVLLTYVASLTSLAWRRRSLLKKKSSRRAATVAPRGMVQIVLVMATFIVLVLGWLLLFGAMATVGLSGTLSSTDTRVLQALLIMLLLLGVLTDETTLSLHPFYRERLASAFAVRRVVRRRDGQAVARPYQPNERTSLSTHGVLATPTEFPHIIFAASATLGQQRTAPGYGRVSYTFCSDWVGGPDVGYVNTRKLEELVPSRLRRDLTVQGAVALSGAAIAASTGGQRSSWYEPLLVVSGVRLGAWMPNPTFLIDRYTTHRSVTRPGLPRARRMNYLVQELFGLHPADGPLLQVTDGGFYDNLGLLELLRRGCTRIYCVDASGDSPPAALTLAQALTRAYQELGVRTELDQNTWSTATAGSGQKLSPEDPLAALSQRLSATGVITGSFRYPDCGPSAGRSGTLVVAKAALWNALPYSLMAYAQNATVFPHDSTADQWFDDRQYAAYTELGRCLGDAAVDAMESATGTGAAAPGSAGPGSAGPGSAGPGSAGLGPAVTISPQGHAPSSERPLTAVSKWVDRAFSRWAEHGRSTDRRSDAVS